MSDKGCNGVMFDKLNGDDMKKLCALPLFLFLYGCSEGAIKELKESTIPGYSSYTIGQLFDNRKLCKSVDWATREGTRGETIIDYTCSMRDVEEFESAFLEESIESFLGLIESGKNIDYEIEQAKKRIVYSEEHLEDVLKRLERDEVHPRAIHLGERLAVLVEQHEELSGLTIDNVVEDEFSTFRIPFEILSASNIIRAKPDNTPARALYKDDEEREERRIVQAKEAIGKFIEDKSKGTLSEIRRLESDIKSINRNLEEERARSLVSAKESIDDRKHRLSELEKEAVVRAENFERVVTEFVAELKNQSDDVYAVEVFSWIVTPDGSFDPVHAGFEGHSRIRGNVNTTYGTHRHALDRIYQDNLQNYEEFLRATGGYAQMRQIVSSYRSALLREF